MIIGKSVMVVVDRPMGSIHPKHKSISYPINYGFIPGVIAADGEEQDAYILGVDQPVDCFEGTVIAVIYRKNDVEEKWMVAPKGATFAKEEIWKAVAFQEQYFEIEIVF